VPSHEPGVHLGLAELFLELKAFDQMLEYFEPAIFFHRYLSKLAMLVQETLYALIHWPAALALTEPCLRSPHGKHRRRMCREGPWTLKL